MNNVKMLSSKELSFLVHTLHLPLCLTWLLQWIPGTFLALRRKQWFAKCHFFLFPFFLPAAWSLVLYQSWQSISFPLNMVCLVCLMVPVFPWLWGLLDEHSGFSRLHNIVVALNSLCFNCHFLFLLEKRKHEQGRSCSGHPVESQFVLPEGV